MWLGENACNLLLYLDGKSIEICHSMKLLGVIIDSDLNFDEHVSELIRNVSKQLQVLNHHKHLISTCAKKRLYDAFLLSCLSYCPIIWHYCGKRNSDKLEWIHESCLHFIYNEYHSSYDKLLININPRSLHNNCGDYNYNYCRIHDMLTLVYESFHGLAPSYINKLLIETNSSYNLRGKHSLSIPRVQSTKYGLHSFCYSASKYWNMLPEVLRTAE